MSSEFLQHLIQGTMSDFQPAPRKGIHEDRTTPKRPTDKQVIKKNHSLSTTSLNSTVSGDEWENEEQNVSAQAVNNSANSQSKNITPELGNNTNNSSSNNRKSQSSMTFSVIGLILVVFAVVIGVMCTDTLKLINLQDGHQMTPKKCTLSKLFNETEQLAIKSAVYEIQNGDLSVLMLIQQKNTQVDVNNERIASILEYSTCKLNNLNAYAEISQELMHTPEIIEDYGKLITKYKPELEKKHVLLVKNLEETPAEVAMLFHFICDQVTPVVEKLLIIFTLEFDEADTHEGTKNLSDFNIVEKVLNAKWKNGLKPDALPPLIARLTNEVMRME